MNGEKAGRKAMASSFTKMAHSTREVGSTIKNTDLETKSGQMAPLMRANILKVSKKVKAHLDGPMDLSILVISLITN